MNEVLEEEDFHSPECPLYFYSKPYAKYVGELHIASLAHLGL